MPAFRQTSFAGGELSNTLWGRSDIAKYAVGLKACRNFFINRHGAAMSRPGTTWISSVKNTSQGQVRLVPFVYSETQAYVLEFGNSYIRFYQNGLPVLFNLLPYEVATPYLTADLPRLKFAQQGSVLTICHPNYPAAELKYTSAASWAYAAIVFDRPKSSGGGVYLQEPMPVADSTHIAKEWVWAVSEIVQDTRGVLYEKAPAILANMGVKFYSYWNSAITYQVGTKVATSNSSSTAGADGGVSNNNYRCLVSCTNVLLSNTTYWVIDNVTTSPTPVQLDPIPSTVVVAPDRPIVMVFNGAYANALTDPSFIGYRFYRGRGGILGWLGDAKSNTTTFTDNGDTPDYTRQPLQGTNPFKFYNASGTLTSTEYPACVTFFEGRRVFANTTQRPGFFWGSAVDDYANFDTHLIPIASQSYNFELASRRVEEIRSLVGWQSLIVGTQSSQWSVSGAQGPLAYNNVNAKVQTNIGTSWLDPIIVQGTLLFARTKGTGIHSLDQDVVRQSWADKDVTILAEHLFIGHQVTDWAYAQDPWQVVWVVRDDGALLSFTYIKDQDIWAWARHDTDGGDVYENVCVVPEGQEDAVYVVVKRTVNGVVYRYVERMATRVIPTLANAICLDCATVSDGGGTKFTDSVVSQLVGRTVYALGDGDVYGPFTVPNSGIVSLPNPCNHIVVGLKYVPQLQVLDVASQQTETKAKYANVTRVGVEVDNTRGLVAGPDLLSTSLVPVLERQVSDSYGAVAGVAKFVVASIPGVWTPGGSFALQQNDPLPVTVLSVLREVEFGDY